MKVIIFGASGGIGKFAVQHALEKGYEVKAFLRNPSKLTIKHKNLTFVQGEINNYNEIKMLYSIVMLLFGVLVFL
jgi:putative NADH-flavin reductase